MNDHPWYLRTEFWAMVVGFGASVLSQTGAIDPNTAKEILNATGSPEAAAQYVSGLGAIWKLLVINMPIAAYVISRGLAKKKGGKSEK